MDSSVYSLIENVLIQTNMFIVNYKLGFFVICSLDYNVVGCYKDTHVRAIPTLEGTNQILDGVYTSRKNAIAKCAVAAMKAGHNMFAVQDGGWCAANDATSKFDKYGKSADCKADGEGGPWANQVYYITGRNQLIQREIY